MLELEENNNLLKNLKQKYKNQVNLFDIAKLEEQLQILEKQTMEENFWNDSKNSSKILTQIKNIKNKTVEYKKIKMKLLIYKSCQNQYNQSQTKKQ